MFHFITLTLVEWVGLFSREKCEVPGLLVFPKPYILIDKQPSIKKRELFRNEFVEPQEFKESQLNL